MPQRPARPCRNPRCRAVTRDGYCLACTEAGVGTMRQRHYDQKQRDPDSERFYNSARWRALRTAQLRREPMCELCRQEGRATIATVADHVIPRHSWTGPGGPDVLENLRSLDASCHNRVRREQGIGGRR